MNDNNRGPFRDLSIPPELYGLVGIDDNGRPYRRLRMEVATQLFLEVFNPANGWAVNIASEVMAMDMRAYDDRNSDTSPLYPVVRFIATLSNPAGAVVATASTLWVIKEATAWEKGETNARQRLYAAMGLSAFRYEEEAQTRQPVRQEENPLGDVRPRPYTGREDARNNASTPSAPVASAAEQADGPDVTDGCDRDGFPGGCERAGHTVDTCPGNQQATTGEDGHDRNTDGESHGAEPGTTQASAGEVTGKRKTRAADAAPSPSILRTIETLCKNLGRDVPQLNTMAEARAFHRSLNEG